MDLNCSEKLSLEYIWSEASAEEVLKLKPLADLKLNILRGHPRGLTRYYFVAGGFAAFVNGRTNTYDDIDIYTTASYRPRRLTYLEYPDRDIDYIDDKYPYQYIHSSKKYSSIQDYVKAILHNFDLDLCAVAYWLETCCSKECMKYYKCERKKDLVAKDVLKFSPKRIEKYATRIKTPFTLKLLALNSVLKNYDINDVAKYLNKIDMSF